MSNRTARGAYGMRAFDYTDGYVQQCRMVDMNDTGPGCSEKPSSGSFSLAHWLTDGLMD